MRLYEDIGTKYKYHGVIEGLGIAGNVYANSFRDLKRKASETANGYFRPLDIMQVWESESKENKPLFKLYRRNYKSPCGDFRPGAWA